MQTKQQTKASKIIKPFGSRLSTGVKNARFKGSVKSMSLSEQTSIQSGNAGN